MVLKNFKFLLVQGRLLPQQNGILQSFPTNWKREFSLMKNLDFFGIEWIFDKKSENYNPIINKKGRKEMMEFSSKFDIRLENIVLDWFMVHPLLVNEEFSINKKIEKLILLIELSAKVRFKHIILPMLEQNNLSSNEKKTKFAKILNDDIRNSLESNNIDLHLETELSPEDEHHFIQQLNNENIRICYDMGNSASMGYNANSISTIQNDLGSVHIKDRKFGGTSVPLGEGSVDFEKVFTILNEINFSGPFSFQVYRNEQSDNASILKESFKFINTTIRKVIK